MLTIYVFIERPGRGHFLPEGKAPGAIALDIGLSGIVIIVGNYGSGKSEVAVNLALAETRRGAAVCLADLDLVNPYFRTREARAALGALGVGLLLPEAAYLDADLPILSPAVAGAIRRQSDREGLTLLDAGGDGAGATVLAALGDALAGRAYRMLQVVNPFRPQTRTPEGCLAIRAEIERASGLAVSGWIGNPHLLEETRAEEIRWGYAQVNALSRTSGLPLVLCTVPSHLAAEFSPADFACPLLEIRRQLVPPWKRAQPLTAPGGAIPPRSRRSAPLRGNTEGGVDP
jgi:hypothetical protein